MTEEDTFRLLRQRPIPEFYHVVYNDCLDLPFQEWLKRKQAILEENGWGMSEFNRAVLKIRNKDLRG